MWICFVLGNLSLPALGKTITVSVSLKLKVRIFSLNTLEINYQDRLISPGLCMKLTFFAEKGLSS